VLCDPNGCMLLLGLDGHLRDAVESTDRTASQTEDYPRHDNLLAQVHYPR